MSTEKDRKYHYELVIGLIKQCETILSVSETQAMNLQDDEEALTYAAKRLAAIKCSLDKLFLQ